MNFNELKNLYKVSPVNNKKYQIPSYREFLN